MNFDKIKEFFDKAVFDTDELKAVAKEIYDTAVQTIDGAKSIEDVNSALDDAKDDIQDVIDQKDGVLDKAYDLRDKLAKDYRVKIDASDKTPGWKFAEQEIQGIPVRVELGPKDIEKNQCVVVRRDTREKLFVSLDELNDKLAEILDTMHEDMLSRAKEFLKGHISDAHDYDEFKKVAEEKPGFIRAMWCGEVECELKIKEDTTVTSRCMPFDDQEQISDVCVCCGKPAHKLVYWGKAY